MPRSVPIATVAGISVRKRQRNGAGRVMKKKGIGQDGPPAVDEFFSLESIDPEFDKPPEFIADMLGYKIPHDEDY